MEATNSWLVLKRPGVLGPYSERALLFCNLVAEQEETYMSNIAPADNLKRELRWWYRIRAVLLFLIQVERRRVN